MDFALGFSFGFDDDMTKSKSGKTADEQAGKRFEVPDQVPVEQSETKVSPKKKATGAKLEKRITEQGFSNASLSARTGVDEGSISRYTKGKIPTKLTDPIKAVCIALRINAAKLIKDGIVETDESIPVEAAISPEEKAKRLLHDDTIGDSFRKIVDSLFEQSLRNRGQSLP